MDIDAGLEAIRTSEQAYGFASAMIEPQTPVAHYTKVMLGKAIVEELALGGDCERDRVVARLVDMQRQTVELRDTADALQAALSRWRSSHDEDVTIRSRAEVDQWARRLIASHWPAEDIAVARRLLAECVATVIEKRGECSDAVLIAALGGREALYDDLAAGAMIARYHLNERGPGRLLH